MTKRLVRNRWFKHDGQKQDSWQGAEGNDGCEYWLHCVSRPWDDYWHPCQYSNRALQCENGRMGAQSVMTKYQATCQAALPFPPLQFYIVWDLLQSSCILEDIQTLELVLDSLLKRKILSPSHMCWGGRACLIAVTLQQGWCVFGSTCTGVFHSHHCPVSVKTRKKIPFVSKLHTCNDSDWRRWRMCVK